MRFHKFERSPKGGELVINLDAITAIEPAPWGVTLHTGSYCHGVKSTLQGVLDLIRDEGREAVDAKDEDVLPSVSDILKGMAELDLPQRLEALRAAESDSRLTRTIGEVLDAGSRRVAWQARLDENFEIEAMVRHSKHPVPWWLTELLLRRQRELLQQREG